MKKILVPAAFVIAIIVSIVWVLANNKAKIDEANQPVDRTNIPVTVNVSKALVEPLNLNVKYPALVKPFDEANIYAQTAGLISSLNIDLGKHVSKGQTIGKIDTRILELNLKKSQVALQTAEINKTKYWDDYQRAKDLFENKAGLETNMLTAKNNYDNSINTVENAKIEISFMKQQIANSAIVAPLSGTVSEHTIKQGEFINPGTSIAKVSNINSLKTTVFVDQQTVYLLKLGQVASISSSIFGETEFSGKIIYISPVADNNHNFQVDLLITKSNQIALKGGTDVEVSFNTISHPNALQIPKSALLTDAKLPYVYVAENGKAVTKNIKTGIVRDDKVQVLSGLQEGEIVITAGQINLTQGSNISIIK